MSSTPTLPGDPQTMPLDQLREQVTAPQPEPQPAAVVPAAPEPFTVQQGDDGLSVQMAAEFGGEVFKGKDWAEVGPKIAKAKADAGAYIKTLKTQPAPAAAPAAPVVPPQPTPEELADKQIDEWMLERTAKALGMTRDQYVQRMTMTFEASEKMQVNNSLAEFHQMCPDYVDTPENSKVIEGYFGESLDHFPSAQELKQAYAMAVYEGKIQRAQRAATPAATPPPMPGTTISSPGGQNPYQMDMAQLRKEAGIG